MTAPRFRSKDLPPHLRDALALQDKAAARPSRKTPKAPRPESPLVASLRRQIADAGLPEPRVEVVFHPTRKWRLDLAWPDRMLAAEVDGGVWTSGRHTRGAGFIEDCVKLNAALVLGWRVLRFPGPHVKNGAALKTLREALAFPGGPAVP